MPIALDLGDPELPVGVDGVLAGFPVVPVPEGAVYEDDQLVFFKTDVRLAGKGCLGVLYQTPACQRAFFRSISGLVPLERIQDMLYDRWTMV